MGDMAWRLGTAPSLDGPERYVVFNMVVDGNGLEAVIDPPVARKMAEALLAEANSAEKEMRALTDGHAHESGLILPPGVKVSGEPSRPPDKVHLACAKCGGVIEIDQDAYVKLRSQSNGRPFDLEHDACPGTEGSTTHNYYVEITIHRDTERPQPPEADTALAWFVAHHEAESFAVALPSINEKLIPFWEKVQANLDIMDAVADSGDIAKP